ncbi:MFS general substrate transporter [Ophiobolus disseminans]|uniref:MFS general substrate transporter n=1 Tax=Ophiobolus disseminans TaxID=1469910 RepID=A0A6A7AKP9_9PLEO|nr:MFS general substrate transporter [Ophiobolus disseminans]
MELKASESDRRKGEEIQATEQLSTLDQITVQPGQAGNASNAEKQGWRFWTITISLCFTSLLTAVEATITATALPSIARELGSRELYIWFVNAIFLSSAIVQPLFDQVAGLFGRRWPCIFAVAIFALGSDIAGGSGSAAMLISGRVLQGIGLGGVNMLIDIIVSDLVPQRKRGAVMGVIFAFFAVGSSMGPFVGGVLVDRTSWRWVFCIGLPVAGVALVLLVAFLHVRYEKETTIMHKLGRLDYAGNAILILSMVSILIARFPSLRGEWDTKEPVMPRRLFTNRTSAVAFVLVFLHGMILYWVTYFLPVYFQAVLLSSPTRSGVQFLPTIIVILPFAVIAGGFVTSTGRYEPLCILGFGLQSLSVGLCTLLGSASSTATWIVFQIIGAAGIGLVTASTLPAVQVGLAESDVAASTATWGFLRSLGSVWGVSISAAVFNSRVESLSSHINDVQVRALLQNRYAYERASATFIGAFPEPTRSEVIGVYEGALRTVWQVLIAFACLGFIITWCLEELQLKKTLETEFGMESKGTKRTDNI